tara:strand:- start:2395 stop:2598 length:204 start_codon:yes stop_codon:yes gene_type:complete
MTTARDLIFHLIDAAECARDMKVVGMSTQEKDEIVQTLDKMYARMKRHRDSESIFSAYKRAWKADVL